MTTEGTLSIVAICAFVAIYFYGRKSREIYIDSLKLDLKHGESHRARQFLEIDQLTSQIKTLSAFNAKLTEASQKNTKQLIETENRERTLIEESEKELQQAKDRERTLIEESEKELQQAKDRERTLIEESEKELQQAFNDINDESLKSKKQEGILNQKILDEKEIIKDFRNRYRDLQSQEKTLKDKNKKLEDFCTETLERLKEEGASLPSAVRWAIKLKEGFDQIIVNRLELPPHPAPKAAAEVKEARSLLRESESEAELLRNRIDLYEAQAPWLIEYQNYSLDEILSGLKEEQETRQCYESGGDPVELFVPRMEWTNLTETERNQKALDRYWEPARTRSAWTAGIQYERYVGYLYETDGYIVTYHGAVEGKEDLGIDLICMKNDIVHLIQCKRLSVVKGKPVRENVVAQIYGAAMFYAMRSGINPKNAKAVIVTTYELSEQALQFAKLLNVSVQERRSFEPYPCIKCNISSADQERIYHLPFDQQYDLTVIEKDKGEFYALTVADAVRAGFRRAYRWRGQT